MCRQQTAGLYRKVVGIKSARRQHCNYQTTPASTRLSVNRSYCQTFLFHQRFGLRLYFLQFSPEHV
jgi:hypothetical protein